MKHHAERLLASGYQQRVDIQSVEAGKTQATKHFRFTLLGQNYPEHLKLLYNDDVSEMLPVTVKSLEQIAPQQWRFGLHCQLNESELNSIMNKLLLHSIAHIKASANKRSQRSTSDKTLQGSI